MDIAIIGQACNLPGAINLQEFCKLIDSNSDYITNSKNHENCSLVQENWIDAAGYLRNFYEFDYKLLGLSLRDSLIIEPQQRLFTQHCWKALENAGYNPLSTGKNVGVFSTSSDSNYHKDLLNSTISLDNYDAFELEIGVNKEQQSTRTSYLLNLTGPSYGVQSACSSGLLTIHVAIQALRADDCDMALAGGACLPFPLHNGYHYREGMNWSATGKIRSFDNSADGMVAGFGCVVFVLKKYEQALLDKDHIFAVIKGSSINNDGHYKSTYTAPSSKSVSQNIKNLLVKTGFSTNDIGFIEAHGSGTKIGDVIEASALSNVFRNANNQESSIAVSSIKSSIGHLDTVAGLAGLLKATQQIINKKVSKAVNFISLNEKISFNGTSLYVPTQIDPLEKTVGIVNSLGIGGTNCALLITGINQNENLINEKNSLHNNIVFIGSQDENHLEIYIQQLAKELDETPYSLKDIVYTLNKRSVHKDIVVSIEAKSIAELKNYLINFNKDNANYVSSESIQLTNYPGFSIPLSSSELDLNIEVKLQYKNIVEKDNSNEKIKNTNEITENLYEHQDAANILKKIWINNLMIEDVLGETSFKKSGGHSILALSFIDDIKRQLHINLDLDWVDNNDLFQQQISYIMLALEKIDKKSYIKPLKQPRNIPKAILILVHASISGYESYKAISELINDDIEVIGIDSHNLYADEKEIISNIDTLTSIYANSITEHIKTKSIPIVIGGWSLGGMMANLICNKLRHIFTIPSLITIDSVVFNKNHKEIFSDENLKYFMDVDNIIPDKNGEVNKHFRRLQHVFKAERKMAMDFIPTVKNIPLLNIVATKSKFEITDPIVYDSFQKAKQDNGWSMLHTVNTHFIASDHEEIVNFTNAKKVSKLINEFIEEHV